MNEWPARAVAVVRRADRAVARASAPGTMVGGWVTAVRRAREQVIRAAGERLPEGALNALTQARGAAGRALTFAATEPTGIAGAVLVLVGGWVLTRLLWTPLSWPASVMNVFISTVTPTSCAMFGPRNFVSDNLCGTVLAVLTVAGALTAMAVLLLLRVPLRRTTSAVLGTVVGPGAFLVTPLSAVVLFTVGWAGVQYHFPGRPGIVPDGDFPALVGVMTYALARYGTAVRGRAGAAFAWATSVSMPARFGIVLLVPFAVSVATIPLWNTPVRDQLAVLAAMGAAYVLFAPGVTRPAGGER